MLLERCDGSAPLPRTEFPRRHHSQSDGQSVGRSDRQTNRTSDRRTSDWVGSRISSPPALLLLRKAWHRREESRDCWECQCDAQTLVSPWLLSLAKQTISFLIMISRVIIYTKVAHPPILRRQGSFFSSGQGENSVLPCVLLKMNVGGEKLLLTEKQSGTLFITLPYS